LDERPSIVNSCRGRPYKGQSALALSSFQILSLEDPREAASIFAQMHGELLDPQTFASRMRLIGASIGARELEEGGWSGIELNGRYFAWGGPRLHVLADRSPVPMPPGLTDALKLAEMTVRIGSLRKLRSNFEKGWAQVFETDRTSFRRAVYQTDQNDILLAKPKVLQGARA
jgi:hypothetical protein